MINQNIDNGIIYYNIGLASFVRMVVSLYSLKKVSNIPVTILCDESSYNICINLKNIFNIEIKKIPFIEGKNSVFLNKCLVHNYTPFKNTIFIDADTIILKNFDELFQIFTEYEFFVSQFSTWKSSDRKIRKRIKAWSDIYPEKIKPAFSVTEAINTGVFGFRDDSSLMKNWYSLAEKGREQFICDETCCQVILPEYNHYVISNIYNTSCKHDIITNESKILHFHGRKHCRLDKNNNYIYNSDKWYNVLKQILHIDIIKNNINKDRQLRKYFKIWNSVY